MSVANTPKIGLGATFKAASQKPQTSLQKLLPDNLYSSIQVQRTKPLQTFNSSTATPSGQLYQARQAAGGAKASAQQARGQLIGMHKQIRRQITSAMQEAAKSTPGVSAGAAHNSAAPSPQRSVAYDIVGNQIDPTNGLAGAAGDLYAGLTGQDLSRDGEAYQAFMANTLTVLQSSPSTVHMMMSEDMNGPAEDAFLDWSEMEIEDLEKLLGDVENLPEMDDLNAEINYIAIAEANYQQAEFTNDALTATALTTNNIDYANATLTVIHGDIQNPQAGAQIFALNEMAAELHPTAKVSTAMRQNNNMGMSA